jgi:hypothetical protein
MAHEAGIEKLYVRGAGEELSVRSRSVALSSWAA